MTTLGPCEVVSAECRQSEGLTRAVCFACGLPACPACSVRMRYLRYGIQRIGFDCIEQGMPFTGPGDRARGRCYVAQILARRARAQERRRQKKPAERAMRVPPARRAEGTST